MNAPQRHVMDAGSWSPRGRKNVFRVLDAWYVACLSSDLKKAPLSRLVLGVPLCLWRQGDGRPAAVLDRCPHRNVPLSGGCVRDGHIECPYHGWRFDGAGKLKAVPGLPIVDGMKLDAPGRCTDAYDVVERDGFIFVWLSTKKPLEEPFRIKQLDWRDGYFHFRRNMRVPGTLHSTIENILDVPHTAFLHGGLFRTEEKKNEIEAVVTRRRDGVQACFLGEPRPEGLIGRVLSPSGGVVEHWDRFFLPSVAQVEYRIGPENHILITSLCTPVTETETDIFTTISLRSRIPPPLLALIASPIVWRVLDQDKVILQAQTELIDRFGTERFTSTPIDLLGPHILHLLKKAEQGALDEAVVREERTRIRT